MKKLFRPRNLLILIGLGVIVGIVLSKKNTAPSPAYPDPWASPSPTAPEGSSESAGGTASNGAAAEPATTGA
jgi:hypothetical protein